jgi:hypothetical protein
LDWVPPAGTERTRIDLGTERWDPAPAERALALRLRDELDHPGIVDLILYGSQARGGRTGFSDVDAILVIADDVAADPRGLRSLRPRVLAAQQAVLTYQPMQHHGFEVATPRLLRMANAAVALPLVALETTRSLYGRGAEAWGRDSATSAARALADLGAIVANMSAWPRHVWHVHGLVSIFELLPALYLQSRETPISKAESFEAAKHALDVSEWPYDLLLTVRSVWPRRAYRKLSLALHVVKNPWVAVAAWRRVPEPVPSAVSELLTRDLLTQLQGIALRMRERVTA